MALTPDDHARVATAVTTAETRTDGEIMAIVTAQSDAYHDVGLHWAILMMFLVLAIVAAVPGHFVGWLDAVDGWGHAWSAGQLLTILTMLLAATFLVWRAAFAWPPLRLALTPRATKARRTRRRAVDLFRAAIEARTASRTGVLIYLSLAERQAEIVADEAIVARVAPEAWGAAMAGLVDEVRAGRPGAGLAAAVAAVGALLAEHFPHTGNDPQELPDRLIEL